MEKRFILAMIVLLVLSACDPGSRRRESQLPQRFTSVSIEGDMFYINGKPTYEGRYWGEHKIEGLLLNSRMVQGIFDDENPDTRELWKYPDTNEWCPERNTNEFIAAMEDWYNHGMLAFTLNLQGGSPIGYNNKGWKNSAFTGKGELKEPFMNRLEKILDRADELGMVVILGVFYFGQDEYLEDEAAVISALDNTLNWLHEKKYRNILVEVNNECDVDKYDHDILKPTRVVELINRVRQKSINGYSFLVSTSFGGWDIPVPTDEVIAASDFVLLHGNPAHTPDLVTEIVKATREQPSYRPMPIVYNEDDHFDFDKPDNNFVSAVKNYASWGYFDYRKKDESFEDGFQSVPVDWGINSERKKQFFHLMSEITGSKPR
jgi:hypothetical protein